MSICDMDVYFDTINVVEEAVTDDTKFPVIKDSKIKTCCKMSLELTKIFINYVRFYNIDVKEKDK